MKTFAEIKNPLANPSKNSLRFAALLAFTLLAAGCAALAPFNQYSANETARLKVEALSLLGKAGQSYGVHPRAADSLLQSVNRAYQDASIRTKNQASMRYWEVLLDSTQGSLAGSLRAWRVNGTLPASEIRRSKKAVSADLDAISKLEDDKGK